MMERFPVSGELALAGEFVGPADAPVVLFLHGGGQTRHAWRATARMIARHGFRTLCVDQRGHGDSDRDPSRRYDMDLFAGDVRALLASIPGVTSIIGASLGGMASLIALGDRAQQTGRPSLVLVDIAHRMEPGGVAEIKGFMAAHLDGFATVDDAADAIAAYLPHRVRRSGTEGLMRNLRQSEDGLLRWHWDPAFITSGLDRPTFSTERLTRAASRLRCPVLLIRGGESRVVSESAAAEFLTIVPTARLVTIGNAHHMVAGDDNHAFNEPLLAFLQSTDTGKQVAENMHG